MKSKELTAKIKELEKEIKDLIEINFCIWKIWRKRHPEDFETPKDSKLVKYTGELK